MVIRDELEKMKAEFEQKSGERRKSIFGISTKLLEEAQNNDEPFIEKQKAKEAPAVVVSMVVPELPPVTFEIKNEALVPPIKKIEEVEDEDLDIPAEMDDLPMLEKATSSHHSFSPGDGEDRKLPDSPGSKGGSRRSFIMSRDINILKLANCDPNNGKEEEKAIKRDRTSSDFEKTQVRKIDFGAVKKTEVQRIQSSSTIETYPKDKLLNKGDSGQPQ